MEGQRVDEALVLASVDDEILLQITRQTKIITMGMWNINSLLSSGLTSS